MDHTPSKSRSVEAASSEAFSDLFAGNPMPMMVYDCDSLQFVDVNDAAIRFYGYPYEEFTSLRLTDIRPPEDVPAMLKAVRRLRGSLTTGQEWRHLRKDGTIVHVLISAHDVVYAGRPCRLVMAQDVTDRKRAEEAHNAIATQVHLERERLHNLLSRAPAVVWEFWDEPDESCQHINYVSRHAETLLGYPMHQWLQDARFWLSIVHPDDRDRAQREAQQFYEAGEGGVSQFRSIARDGSIVWIEATSAVIYDAEGRRIGVRGVNVDITERKRAEEALRLSEERYRLVEQATNDVIWDWDLKTGSLHHNDAILSVLRFAPDQVGSDYKWGYENTHPADRDRIAAEIQAVINGDGSYWTGEHRYRRGDGTWATVMNRSYLMRDADGKAVRMIGSMIDITERTRTIQALRFLAQASETLSSSLDYETTLDNLVHVIVPYLADYCTIDMMSEGGGIQPLAMAHVSPSKEAVLRRMKLCNQLPPNDPHPIRQALFAGTTAVHRNVLPRFLLEAATQRDMLEDWRILHPISYMAVPLRIRGEVFGAITFASSESGRIYTDDDVEMAEELARRAAVAVDNARLYRQIKRADRAKDEFLAMLGHELRNPLSAISNAMQLVRLRGQAEPRLQKTLEVVERQASHMARLVDDLLDVSRITQGKIELRRETVALAGIVDLAVQAAKPMLDARRHTLDVRIADEPIWLDADPVRIGQVVGNLLSNAAKYTEPRGTVTVAAEAEGDSAVVRVKDTGCGIPKDMLDNVFDLFTQGNQSLERAEGGLGIGLTLVKTLTQMHGGSVSALSDGLGKGSEFIVRLPRVAAPASRPESSSESRERAAEHALRILLVEDNMDAARTLAEILEMWGHIVRVAYDGHAAVELAGQQDADVVLLDIGLPGMDGYEVARKMRDCSLLPDAVLVALSGYGQREDQRRSREAGFHHHLVKPVNFDALERLLAGLCAARAAD